jgi:putative transposase
VGAKKVESLGTVAQKRAAVDPRSSELSLRRQCELLGFSRRAFYYSPRGESDFNLELMRRIDRIHLRRPFMGIRMMTDTLRLLDYRVNYKRIARLMRVMGIESLAPGPNTSRAGKGTNHRIYPYLLRGRTINGPNQVWCTDITYLPMDKGFMYLVAVMDWWSRYVLSWQLSNTMDVDFCLDALGKAVGHAGTPPLIFNTDQGSQFTSLAFTGLLREHGVAASMDGRGRYLDNIFIERLWRSFKTEEIYLKEYVSVPELHDGTSDWFRFYNTERPHRSLNRRPPVECYQAPNEHGGREAQWDDIESIRSFWN